MTTAQVITLLITGTVVGFLSSLLGIGGALILTPIQYLVFVDMGVPADTAIKLAFGTNLLVIIPTAISGVWKHHQNRLVYWKAALIMGGCSFAASFIGSYIASRLPGMALKTAFGVLILISGIRMLTARLPAIQEEPKDNPWLLVAWAIPIGIITGLLGIGGGIITIPVMTLALRFRMHHAVATSLAMMILTTTGGVIGYIVNGLGASGLPPYSIGYVNLQSWFLLAVTSVGMAQVGAITAHRIPAKHLKYIFVAIIFYMGLKMLGVFDWLGWPL